MLATNYDDLKKLCDIKDDIIAIDTEFMRDKTFYPIPSLIQVATQQNAFAVDALSCSDISPLKNLLNKNNVVKIIHSCRQDLEVFDRLFGFIPQNFFDTQIAAQFLNYQNAPSLDVLLTNELGIHLDKQNQHSNWIKRPLSSSQIKYALSDVLYLLNLYNKLKAKLGYKYEWVVEESNAIKDTSELYQSPEYIFSKLSVNFSKKIHLARVWRLVVFREDKAKELDVPRSKVLSDIVILKCAKSPDYANLKFVMTEEQFGSFNNSEISEDEMSIVSKNKKNISYHSNHELVFMLRNLLNAVASENGISPSIIANTSELEKMALGKKSKVAIGWRNEIFGKKAFELIDEYNNASESEV